ncbi:MAG: EFR1 family ferrodoxin [Planctomycetes bacterium]|nr:EFR1 family ferrodoxin [Planctomycetota bacterium]
MNKQTPYKHLNVYYFTGTGNSGRSATWVAEAAMEKGIPTIIKPIDSAKPNEEITKGKQTMLVLGMPTHGFSPPYSMFRFALKLPRGKGTKAAVFATRAGILIGKLHPPGLAGFSPFLISLILLFKGYCLKGIKTLNMPSNWIQVHPGYREKNARIIINKSKPYFDRFADKILCGKSSFFSVNNLYEFVFGMFFLPISIMYFLMGRFCLAKLNFATRECDGCGICAEICPVNAIKMTGRKHRRPYWTYACEACNRCIAYCPKKAIEASHQLLVFWILVTMSYSILQVLHLSSYFADLGPFTVNIREFTETIVIYPFVFLTYFIFHLLMRVPILNRLFTFTTFTHYFTRYREPDTKTKDLKGDRNQ